METSRWSARLKDGTTLTLKPEWSLMACPHLAEMPAIRWKLENLARLKKVNPAKFQRQTDELRRRFEATS